MNILRVLRRSTSANAISVINDLNVAKTSSIIHDKYVVVPADEGQNNIIFVCKTHYIQCLSSEIDAENKSSNNTYIPTTFSQRRESGKPQIRFIFIIFIPSIYWIPNPHKTAFKQCFVAGSTKCTTKSFLKLLTSIGTAVKEGLQSNHNTCYSRNGINSMWII